MRLSSKNKIVEDCIFIIEDVIERGYWNNDALNEASFRETEIFIFYDPVSLRHNLCYVS